MTATIPVAAWYRRNAADPESDIAYHFPALTYAVTQRDPCVVIELGVREGHSTSCFLAALASRGYGSGLWSVDIEPTSLPGREGWTFIHGDDMDPTVQAQLPDVADIVFIDTDHSYAHTLAELEFYGDRVRPGGLIFLHDTENEQPEQHGEQIGMQRPFPVREAMLDYCNLRALGWSNDSNSWGLGTVFV